MDYFPMATGTKSNADINLAPYVKSRFQEKQTLWEERNTIIEDQLEASNSMVTVTQGSEEYAYYSAKSIGQVVKNYYTSVLPHKAVNFLLSTKLHAEIGRAHV